jgi:hypothetical protein
MGRPRIIRSASGIAQFIEERCMPIPESGCLIWMHELSNMGYGICRLNGERRLVHRRMFEAVKGEIPPGAVLDHLCRTPSCCNPNHLEAVSQKTNVLRGIGIMANKSRQTHCKRGHELAGDNLLPHKLKIGRRCCKECQRLRNIKAI